MKSFIRYYNHFCVHFSQSDDMEEAYDMEIIDEIGRSFMGNRVNKKYINNRVFMENFISISVGEEILSELKGL